MGASEDDRPRIFLFYFLNMSEAPRAPSDSNVVAPQDPEPIPAKKLPDTPVSAADLEMIPTENHMNDHSHILEKPSTTHSVTAQKPKKSSKNEPAPPRIIEFKPSLKQYEAYKLLTDSTTTEIGYGGAAYGGKTYLGCFYITAMCLANAGTGWLIGRKDLINLRRTTLLTLFKLWVDLGIKPEEYNYNQQSNIITWQNGSQIFLFDLAYQPSDPLFTRLGGLEITGAFIDESNEVPEQAINIILTRIGRRKNEEYKLTPKLLEGFNPDKGHVYNRYYKPWRDNQLPLHRRFIKALPTDNPTVTEQYLNQLRNSDKITRERLLLGNFEYDDDPSALMTYDAICDLFTNTAIPSEEKYLTADIARYGQDKTIIMLWRGLECYAVHEYSKQGLDMTALRIRDFCSVEHIPFSHVIIDEDGVGGGVVDSLRGVKGFVANSHAIDNPITHEAENYANLKAQCTYRMADFVNDHRIALRFDGVAKQLIIEELEQVKTKDIDKNRKRQIRGKDEIKELLGRSPDYSDAMMMRMWFELKPVSAGTARQFYPTLNKSGPTSLARNPQAGSRQFIPNLRRAKIKEF